MHSMLPYILAMVAIIVLLNMLATKLKIAYPILLVLAGLLVSLIPGLPNGKMDPDIIFFIFLPPLLFEAAWSISFKEMKKWWRIIGSFAFLVVFFTALSVALVTNYYIPGFTLALGFLLGGIVSPPDAVSTGAITKFVKIPKSTKTILEGESLLNDASSLIIFRFAVVAVASGQFIWQEAISSFFWMVIGGAFIGIALAWLFVKIHKILPTDPSSDIALTFIEPYIMYWIAEEAHSSGVLAVVSGGLYMSAKRLTYLSSSSRIRGQSVWDSVVFLLNGIVFLIIGLRLPEIVSGIQAKGISINTAIGYGILVTVVLIVARIISSYIALIATLLFRRNVIHTVSTAQNRWLIPIVLGWTGMRGVVSLAAALAIPLTTDAGEAFPYRNLILFITFIVILLTLVIQGLTLPVLIKRGKIFDGSMEEDQEELDRKTMKQGLKQHVILHLKSNYSDEIVQLKGIENIIKQWEERAEASDDSWMNDKIKIIFIELLEVQRIYLTKLNQDDKINEEIIRQQLYQLDLEEERLKII